MLGIKRKTHNTFEIKKVLWSIIERFRPLNLINTSFYFSVIFLSLSFVIAVISLWSEGSTNNIEYLKNFWPLFALNVAIITFTYNIRRHLSEDYYKESIEQLSKAFETLNVKDEKGVLNNDRLRWLYCARMLCTSELLSKKIMMSSHKIIYKESRQYWKLKFGDIISNFDETFFTVSPEKMLSWSGLDREPLDESSLVVIYRFMSWDKKYSDPLKNETFTESDLEDLRRKGYTGLYRLIIKIKELLKKY